MILKRIFTLPASVTVVTQVHGWKFGKTDFTFLIFEMLEELDLVKEFASNTWTNKYECISDFESYDYWKGKNRRRKAFAFDEAIEATAKRRAMSSINVQWIKRIPQLSKQGGGHLIVITQSQRLTESAFFNWTFLRGVWRKLSRKTVEFNNPQWYDEPFVFENIPRTSVEFDQYEITTFKLRSDKETVTPLGDIGTQILNKWVDGTSYKDLLIQYRGEIVNNQTLNSIEQIKRAIKLQVGLLNKKHSYPLEVEKPQIVLPKA
jgi:hypothetical protein